MHIICEICSNRGCDCWVERKSVILSKRGIRASDDEPTEIWFETDTHERAAAPMDRDSAQYSRWNNEFYSEIESAYAKANTASAFLKKKKVA